MLTCACFLYNIFHSIVLVNGGREVEADVGIFSGETKRVLGVVVGPKSNFILMISPQIKRFGS